VPAQLLKWPTVEMDVLCHIHRLPCLDWKYWCV